MVNGILPASLKEALEAHANSGITPYAGGTELMVQEKRAGSYLFLHKVPEMRAISTTGGKVRMGAACTYSEILDSADVPELLKKAVSQIAAPGIRSIATIGGNLCNASPAGDTLPVLYLCDATVEVAGLDAAGNVQTRTLPIAEFILGVRKTALAAGELLVAIELAVPAFTHVVYEKVGARKAQAISKLSFVGGAVVQNGKLCDFRVAFGAVAPTVVRRPELEQAMVQNPAAFSAAAYAPFITPIDDVRSTAEYRKQVCLNLLADFAKSVAQN